MASRKRHEPAQDDLFNPEVELMLPTRLAIEGKVLGSPIRQLAVPLLRVQCRLRPLFDTPCDWSRNHAAVRRDTEDHQPEDTRSARP